MNIRSQFPLSKLKMHAYTTRWTKEEIDDLKRLSGDQGIPVSRLIRIGLLYYYAQSDEWEAFKNVRGVDRLAKNKVLEDLKKSVEEIIK
jgi:hypothetical protein